MKKEREGITFTSLSALFWLMLGPGDHDTTTRMSRCVPVGSVCGLFLLNRNHVSPQTVNEKDVEAQMRLADLTPALAQARIDRKTIEQHHSRTTKPKEFAPPAASSFESGAVGRNIANMPGLRQVRLTHSLVVAQPQVLS